MKTKEYVKKFKLDKKKKFNHNEFIQDLTTDFLSLLEIGKTKSNEFKIKGFENTVNAIRQKWDGIHKKALFGLPEKLWNYFYATVIINMKKEMFPNIMKMRKEERERRKRIWEDRKKQEKEMFDDWSRFFYQSLFSEIFKKMSIPRSSFETLGLLENSTKEDVIKSYRKLSLKHHPDVGGKQEMFLKITEAKNKCLTYLENK